MRDLVSQAGVLGRKEGCGGALRIGFRPAVPLPPGPFLPEQKPSPDGLPASSGPTSIKRAPSPRPQGSTAEKQPGPGILW